MFNNLHDKKSFSYIYVEAILNQKYNNLNERFYTLTKSPSGSSSAVVVFFSSFYKN